MWLRAVARRASSSTVSTASLPAETAPEATSTECTVRLGAGLRVSATRALPSGVAMVPVSPNWPPDSP